jgi:cell division protein FtsL
MKNTSQFEKIQEDLLPIQSYVRDFRSQITNKKEEKFALKVEVLMDSLRREIKDFVSEQTPKN